MKRPNPQITINQHIVPQRHLRNFLIPGGTKLERFNIDALRIESPQSPKSACSEEFYYALTPGEYDEYSQVVENAFGNIEDWYGKNINRIESQLLLSKALSDQDRYQVSAVIANFYFRGYKHREEVRRASIELINWAFPNNEEAASSAAKTSHATNASFDIGHANTLTHKHWRILINHSETHPFITSDEAVVEVYDSRIPKNLILAGSFSLQTQIFHLSPKIAIISLWPFAEKDQGITEFLDVTDNELGIDRNNLQYIKHAHKYAYAPNKILFNKIISGNHAVQDSK